MGYTNGETGTNWCGIPKERKGSLNLKNTINIEAVKSLYEFMEVDAIRITTENTKPEIIRADAPEFFSHLSAVYTHLGDIESLRKLHDAFKLDAMPLLGMSPAAAALLPSRPLLKRVGGRRATTYYARPDGTGRASMGSLTPQISNSAEFSRRRRMAQREFSNRRDSPVMVRLLQQIIAAQDD